MLLEEFSTIFDRPEKIKKLREYILSLAVRGKLVKQDESDEPANVLLERIREEKNRLVNEKKIKKEKPLPEISEDEMPYELPTGWEWSRLGNLIFLTSGISYKKYQAKFNKDSGYGFVIRGGNIQLDNLVDAHDNTYIPLELFKDYHYLKKNDTIMVSSSGTRTSIGKSAFIEVDLPESTVGAFLFIIRPYTNLDAKYIHYLIKIYREKIIDISLGTNINNIKRDVFNSMIVPVAPLNEQKRIVEKVDYLMEFCDKLESQLEKKVTYGSLSAKSILNDVSNCSTYKELEETLRFIIENFKDLTLPDRAIDELKNAILSLAVKGKLVQQNDTDEPASVLLEKIREEKNRLIKENKIKKERPLPQISDEEIPYELPKCWEWVRMRQLAKNIHYGHTASAKSDDTGVKFVRITDIQKNMVNWETVPYCDIDDKKLETSKLENNDILIARTGGTIGKSFIVENVEYCAVFASYLIRVIPLKSIHPRYLKLFLETPLYWTQLISKSQGTGQPNVNAVSLSELIMPLPPLNEQKRIVDRVDKLIKICDELELRIEKSKEYSEQLMESILKDSFKA